MEQKHTDYLEDLRSYFSELAIWRVEAIEREMRRKPEQHPDFTASLKQIDREQAALAEKLGGDIAATEPIMRAVMTYHSELVFEIYRQAVLDGGRVYHAFVTNELPKDDRPMIGDEQMNKVLLDLKTRQLANERMPCPRCGCDAMNEQPIRNALSCQADIFVCDSCGVDEALRAMLQKPKPLCEWACFVPNDDGQ